MKSDGSRVLRLERSVTGLGRPAGGTAHSRPRPRLLGSGPGREGGAAKRARPKSAQLGINSFGPEILCFLLFSLDCTKMGL